MIDNITPQKKSTSNPQIKRVKENVDESLAGSNAFCKHSDIKNFFQKDN